MRFRDAAQQFIYTGIQPIINFLVRYKISPNTITTIGLFLNLTVVFILIFGANYSTKDNFNYLGFAGYMILFAGLFDMIDGQVARYGNMTTPFGALYDSVLDRYSELFMFFGICYYLVYYHYFFGSIMCFVALIGSIMVSYTRARAEGLGIECKDGLMQRPERIITIAFTGIICSIIAPRIGADARFTVTSFIVLEPISIFTIPIGILAILTNYTAITRLLYCKKVMQST
jgi:CDP-diacylglycerol---glycerol-3-phosphate 3-phosphatidyltransferase